MTKKLLTFTKFIEVHKELRDTKTNQHKPRIQKDPRKRKKEKYFFSLSRISGFNSSLTEPLNA